MTRQKEEARREAGLKGLYRSELEHDACGVGAVVNIKGRASHKVIEDALLILHNLDHRGAVGADPLCGDGAGILILKTVESTLSQIRRRRARGTSGLWPSSP